MRHVVMLSGGIGSWATAKRVAEKYGAGAVECVFADTLTEDEDLYRFVVDGLANLYGVTIPPDVDRLARTVPPVPQTAARWTHLCKLADAITQLMPNVWWLIEGRNIWQVFKDSRFLGNNRIDPCSRVLKREICRKWLDNSCDPSEAVVYLGYDWSESHRVERAQPFWEPWRVAAPMTEEPYLDKAEMIGLLTAAGIETPRLYLMGLPHNNCGGGCVKAGMAHWRHLLKVFPERYLEWEAEEEALRQYLGKDVAMLRDRSSAAKCKACHGSGGKPVEKEITAPVRVEALPDGGWVASYTLQERATEIVMELCEACQGTGRATRPLTLRQLREQTLIQGGLFDSDDWGGCGCFSGEEAEAEVAAASQV